MNELVCGNNNNFNSPNNNNYNSNLVRRHGKELSDERQAKEKRRRRKRTVGRLFGSNNSLLNSVFGRGKKKPSKFAQQGINQQTNQSFRPTDPPLSLPQSSNCFNSQKNVCDWVPYKKTCYNRPVTECTSQPVQQCSKQCKNVYYCVNLNNNSKFYGKSMILHN